MEMDEKVDMLRSFQDPGQCRPDPIKPEWLDAALAPRVKGTPPLAVDPSSFSQESGWCDS